MSPFFKEGIIFLWPCEMAFVGSKAKGADHILEVLNDPIFDGMHYVEPFCGYCHILRRVENKKSYKASDCNPLLITLLKAIQSKRKLPVINESESIAYN